MNRSRRLRWALLGAIASLVLSTAPGALASELEIGARAPDFALEGSDGKVHRLQDYRGRTVVLAWFPKAFTGG